MVQHLCLPTVVHFAIFGVGAVLFLPMFSPMEETNTMIPFHPVFSHYFFTSFLRILYLLMWTRTVPSDKWWWAVYFANINQIMMDFLFFGIIYLDESELLSAAYKAYYGGAYPVLLAAFVVDPIILFYHVYYYCDLYDE